MNQTVALPNAKPSVSTRVSISWPPAPPYEDSSVLVLNSCSYESAAKGLPFLLYLDLRLSLPVSSSSKITWAFAGLRHTLRTGHHPKFRWDHFIDSRRGMESNDAVDEGEAVISNDPATGNEIEVETGVGWNPESGRLQKYEEVWSEEAMAPGLSYVFLTSDEEPQNSNSFIAILGSHALALSQTNGEPFQAVRMAKTPSPSIRSAENLHGWKAIYSTLSPSESNPLGAVLSEFLDLLHSKESSNTIDLWIRGEKIRLGPENVSRYWTVFDCGITSS